MSATPALASAGVRLRPMTFRDQALYLQLYCDASVMQHIAEPLAPAQACAGFRRDLCRQANSSAFATRWIVCTPGDDSGIGLVGLTPDAAGNDAEIGIMLAPPAQGQGRARQALSLVVRAAFERRWADALRARHRPANRAMQRVLEALAFERGVAGADEVRWHLRAPRRRDDPDLHEAPGNRLGTRAFDGLT